MSYINPIEIKTKNNKKILIRTATKEDGEKVNNHFKASFLETNLLIIQPEEFSVTINQQSDWLDDCEKDSNSLVLIALHEEEIVGLISFEGNNKKLLNHHGTFGVNVRDQWQGNGVGEVLVQTLLTWCEENPEIEKVCLGVLGTNNAAIQLYKKLGFREEGRKVNQIKFKDGTYADDVLMYKFVK